ncbi:helix-turn-helix transcriptional regulator [Nocardia uniformis]|uniref:Helix-turn-helix transcriptional regulator n=1 Tax=Nocardia uniformis TaxID=53432 RepID=A0A849C4X2_9NOCA|nr:helix-turn-helix domain-containing protein [Nocardia uniformis]NNH72696.1 helix-turn-helix transcriptional regulator [Nocardia uniformis]
MSALALPTDPAGRVDARRNRALVLAAAQRAFAEQGMSVSLVEIAKRAGVGAGTVHRHFPSKNDLIAAVLRQRVERLAELATRSRGAADVGAAFFDFCIEVVTTTPGNKGMCDVFETDDGWPSTALVDAGTRFQHAVADLLLAAQRQEAVRSDLTLSDVLEIFTGCAAMQRSSGARRGPTRPVVMLLEAMRARDHGARVTKLSGADRRNEKGSRNATADAHCPVCAAPVRHSATGRPARYCSPACRQKAHRQRARAAS